MNSSKRDFPTEKARQYLEPGTIVLLSSHCRGQNNIMTLGWHTMLEFSPSLLLGCVIAANNHSFSLVQDSGECVINLPTTDLTDKVVKIGNSHGAEVDKFQENDLTPLKAERVSAPLIAECHACFECRLFDDQLVDRYNFFIFEIVKSHVAARPKHPQTLHYTGEGVFMVAGNIISRRGQFKPEML